mgnify:CR=1 FL=1
MNTNLREQIGRKYTALKEHLDEKSRRLWAGTEARELGHGGATVVSDATGIALSAVRRGLQEVSSGDVLADRVRRPGGGRKKLIDHDPELVVALRALVEPATRGDPESALCWTSKSTRKLSMELGARGRKVSPSTVGRLLKSMGFTLQRTRKTEDGRNHIDRDAQFHYINDKVREFHGSNDPAISVDTKKKELVGNFANGGEEWRPSGAPLRVKVHDFPSDADGKAVPYGVYDIGRNEGWVSVGISKDTAEFSTNTIEAWWRGMGEAIYPDATRLLVTADCGGSNGNRLRLWRLELQKLADATGLKITVCHFPSGTSKWNKIEHRMWSQVTRNWRGRPLTSFAVIVRLIGATTTTRGLKINAKLDERTYANGTKVTDKQLEAVQLRRHEFHGEWNYTITPKNQTEKC